MNNTVVACRNTSTALTRVCTGRHSSNRPKRHPSSWSCDLRNAPATHVLRNTMTPVSGAPTLYTGTLTAKHAILLGGIVGEKRCQGQYAKRMRPYPMDTECVWEDAEKRTSARTPVVAHVHPWHFVALHRCTRPSPSYMLRETTGVQRGMEWTNVSLNIRTITTCTAPIWSAPRGVDMHTWVTLNLRKHVQRFVLYVRSDLIEAYRQQLRWYIDNSIVVIHDIGPLRPPRNVDAQNRTENYDVGDVEVHKEYGDQVIWLNHCLHRYGHDSRFLVAIDTDEGLAGSAPSLVESLNASQPWRLQTIAYGSPTCTRRDPSVPFTNLYLYRQATPIQRGWPRAKSIVPGNGASHFWMHEVFDKKDACETQATLPYESAYLAHYVDKEAESIIHGGRCRCSSIEATLPCTVDDATLAIHRPTSPSHRLLVYSENDGMNNQFIALRHACWLGNLTQRSVVVFDYLQTHLQTLVSPERRIALCNMLDCEHLKNHCGTGVVWMSDFTEGLADTDQCTGVDCYERPSDKRVLYIPNKVVFQLGLQPSTFGFTNQVRHMVDPIRIRAARWPIDETRAPYNVLHVRQWTENDHVGSVAKTAGKTRFRAILKHVKSVENRHPWFVMTKNGKCNHIFLVRTMRMMSLNVSCQDYNALVHPYIDCFTQQVRAVHAQVFIGDPLSTSSQNVIRWRHDPGCTPSWCSDGIFSRKLRPA